MQVGRLPAEFPGVKLSILIIQCVARFLSFLAQGTERHYSAPYNVRTMNKYFVHSNRHIVPVIQGCLNPSCLGAIISETLSMDCVLAVYHIEYTTHSVQ